VAGDAYRTVVDWSAPGTTLDDEAYSTVTRFDAVNRPVSVTTPGGDVLRPGYNEANLLERIDVQLAGDAAATAFVTGIDYDAHARQTRIAYGNGQTSDYEYDPATFRLTRQHTGSLQDLRYFYDPVGNITRIRDEARQDVFFAGQVVAAGAEYRYDAAYRLVEATGREHLGQTGAPIPHSADDLLRTLLPQPGDGAKLGRYTEHYTYDPAGNLLEMRHVGAQPAQPGWTRGFEQVAGTNRLASSGSEQYAYDVHGNMVSMPPLTGLHWNHDDQLHRVDLGGGGTAYYVYDAAGQRVRKVWEKSPGLVEERIYLDGWEIYRRHQGADLLERTTLRVSAGDQTVALVESRTRDTGGRDQAPARLIRYQLADHLGSTAVELDETAEVISYEEYTPYGSTAYQATKLPKRYRFTGAERDEESGLSYHGARYYAPWLARWISPDPAGVDAGLNLYQYANSRPTIHVDPTGEWAILVGAVVVAVISIMVNASAANGPTNAHQAEHGEPRIGDTEFAARTAVMAAGGTAGGAAGGAVMRGAPPVMRVLAGGAVGGGLQAVGDQAVTDVKQGELSDAKTYTKQVVGGTAGGAVTGVVVAGAGKVIAAEARGLTGAGKPPANPYNTKANARYYAHAPAERRSLSAAANWDPTKPGPTKGQQHAASQERAERHFASGGSVTHLKPKSSYEKHHIASDKSHAGDNWTGKFKHLFEGADMTLNDDLNKVWLENHGSNHGAVYHKAIFNRLGKAVAAETYGTAGYRTALREELKRLRVEVTTKGTDLNDLATRKW
jgi:RHS repeat-associated protein